MIFLKQAFGHTYPYRWIAKIITRGKKNLAETFGIGVKNYCWLFLWIRLGISRLRLDLEVWRDTSRQFMNHKEITTVILVENPSLCQDLWGNTLRQSMKNKKITNVVLVEKPSINQGIWIITSRHYMKDKEIINVIFVTSPSFN